MNDKIYPLAYTLSPSQTCTLYHVGFPAQWKEALLDLARKNNPRFQDTYGLPTKPLKTLIENWMAGIIALTPLKKGSDDAHWLTACHAFSEEDLQRLCETIQVWIKATYVAAQRVSPFVQKMANDLCAQIKADALLTRRSSSQICLTPDDGTVCEEAYQAIPFLAVNRLLGEEIVLCGQTLHLCACAKNQIISDPICDPNSHHLYAFVFDFSVQTTPPKRKALLLCQMSMRRWIPEPFVKDRVPILKEQIHAHIKVGPDKYCQIPIAYSYAARRVDWQVQAKECYNIWGYAPLPPAEDVLRNPAAYENQILLPYKTGKNGWKEPKIGTGVSVVDKVFLSQAIAELLGDMVRGQPEAARVRQHGQNFSCFSAPQDYGNPKEFRNWVRQCVETDEIVFELYGLWKDPAQRELLQQIQTEIEQHFGLNDTHTASCLQIHCVCKEVGTFADAMPDDRKETKIMRCDEITDALGRTDVVTGCIFVLPGQEQYPQGDPKHVLRNAFARTGRVVQFITPEDTDLSHKIPNAIYDLYRQLGVVTLLNTSKQAPPLAHIPCVGMYLYTQIHGRANKARFLPLYVTVNIPEGKTRVHCDAFPRRTVSYREACLEMAKLFWESDLEQRCISASRAPAKQKLIALKNQYDTKENGVLLVVQSDGNTRAVWSGISDKEIGRYALTQPYCPTEINVGMPQSPYLMSLMDSGIRIIRVRNNEEVPDYYTGHSKKSTDARLQFASASGIFQYDDVYWGIHERPNDPQYTSSFRASRIDHPDQRFAEKDMIELYPVQLQPGDQAKHWVFYSNALCHIAIQYQQSTTLPLPLHLAQRLKEYLFDA